MPSDTKKQPPTPPATPENPVPAWRVSTTHNERPVLVAYTWAGESSRNGQMLLTIAESDRFRRDRGRDHSRTALGLINHDTFLCPAAALAALEDKSEALLFRLRRDLEAAEAHVEAELAKAKAALTEALS